MKLGLVRRGYSPTGGAENYLLRLADALGQAGHEVILFSDRVWPVGIRQVTWETKGAMNFAEAFRQFAPEHGCDFTLSLERVWSCDAYRAGDGVHVECLERRARFEPRWRSLFRRLHPKHRQILALERALFGGGAGRVIANSRMVKEQIVARFGYPAERIDVVYNGVPAFATAPDARAPKRRELGLAPDEFALLFAGTGWERKGLRFAIEAANRAGVTLLVAGRGSQRGLPQSERVRWLGPVSEMGPVFAAADAFILPTIYEPFSNACLEALAVGLPVITTSANGFSEIIEDSVEGAVIADPADVCALAVAIEHWREPARRAAIQTQLIEKGARFSIDENVRVTLALIG